MATFTVTLPADCTGACRDAYAWALSAFFDGRDVDARVGGGSDRDWPG